MSSSPPRFIDHRGCRIAYEIQGEGPPVLWIQGVGVHGSGWRPQIDGLSDRYQCLSFDNRGLGQSQPPGVPITVEQMAEDALALMDAEGWKSAHIVGHSLGGLVALHLALTARERTRSLSLLCTFADGRDGGRPTPWMIWVGMRTRIGTRRMRQRAFLKILLPPQELAVVDQDQLAKQLAPLFGHDLGDQPPVVGDQLAAMRAYNALPRLGELAGLPTLAASAVHDRIAPPKVGRAMAAAIPGARYVEIADAAHGWPIQKPEETNALLHDHFASAEECHSA